MNRLIATCLMLALLAGGLAALRSAEPADNKDGKPPDVKTDVTKEVQNWNSDGILSPPTEFRKGTVTPRELDKKALAKIENGFQISLPSNAPVPTLTIYDGKIYASGGFHSKEYYCFKADTGELVWGVNIDDDGPSAAVVEDNVAVFNTESCTIFALDAKTGKQLWSYWLGDPMTSTPAIANGKVFASYPASGRATGQQMGNNAPAQPQQKAPPVKGNNAKAAPPCSHVLAAFDLKTGKILWQRWLDSDVMSAPIAVDKELYVSSFAGVIYKFKQEDGTVLSAVKSRATSAPVVAGKNMYVTRRADDGKSEAKEDIASVNRANHAVTAASTAKSAPHIDPNVQRGANLAKEGKGLDAGNGFADGAQCKPIPRQPSGISARQTSRPCRPSRGHAFSTAMAATSTRWATRSSAPTRKQARICGRTSSRAISRKKAVFWLLLQLPPAACSSLLHFRVTFCRWIRRRARF